MGRPKSKPSEIRSRVAFVRLREEESEGLKKLAENLGETPSRDHSSPHSRSPQRQSGLLR